MELNQELQNTEELQTTVSQQLVLAPEVIESIEILQLPTTDLRELIQTELETNPTLELEEETPDDEEFDLEEDSLDREEDDDFDDERLLEMLEERRGRDETFQGYDYEGADRKMDALYNTPAPEQGFQEDLIQEIQLSDEPEHIRKIAEFLAFNLNEDGFLEVDLDEALESINDNLRQVAKQFIDRIRSSRPAPDGTIPLERFRREIQGSENEAFQERILDELAERGELPSSTDELLDAVLFTDEDAERGLNLLQNLGPPGLGARSEQECLRLQLDPDDEAYELKNRIVSEHLEDVRDNNLKKLSRELDLDLDRVKSLVEEIRSLEQKPGQEISGEPAREITPDVVVRKVNGDYEVEMNDSYVPQVNVSRKYLDLLRNDSLSKEAKDYVKKKLKSAKNLKSSIQQRRETIQSVAEVIVDRQEEFLEKGVNFLKPLKMEEVADEVGCHLSTVSRATDGKYMQTPWKVIPMKGFFTQGARGANGEDGPSRVSVMNRIKTIIDEEDKSNPLSDNAIAQELEDRFDIDISRRTVNKYRKELDIPSSTKRKEY